MAGYIFPSPNQIIPNLYIYDILPVLILLLHASSDWAALT